MTLTPDELARYARHIVLHEIGGPGQQRLRAARVLVVGAGGLGSPALLYLAAAGVGALGVVDDDRVSLSNLQRQVIHATAEIGRPKTDSAAHALARLNPHVAVEPHTLRLDATSAARLVPAYDLVLDGSDNFPTRYLVNAACVAAARPLISAAMSQWEGQIALFDPARGGPCYRCLFPEPPAPELAPACAQAGVIGALPGVMGAMMALEAVKLVAGAGASLRGLLLVYDALNAETRRIRTAAQPDCPVCRGAGRVP
jgi:molybdopterin/thiamine biosynthesis adenylyltransferase